MRHQQRTSGFGLIEILIAVAIIGILAAIAIPAYQGYVKQSRETAFQEAFNELYEAMQLYVVTHGKLPDTLAAMGADSHDVGLELKLGQLAVDGHSTNLLAIRDGALNFGIQIDASDSRVTWRCMAPNPGTLLPQQCQGTYTPGHAHTYSAGQVPAGTSHSAPALASQTASSVPPAQPQPNKPASPCGDGYRVDPINAQRCVADCPAGYEPHVVGTNSGNRVACYKACPAGMQPDMKHDCCAQPDTVPPAGLKICGVMDASTPIVKAELGVMPAVKPLPSAAKP